MASDKVSYEPADGIADGKEYGHLRENFLSPAKALESDAANSLANLDGTISTALTNKTNVFAQRRGELSILSKTVSTIMTAEMERMVATDTATQP